MNNKGKLYGLDLFSGIGGNTLGLGDYVRTIAYCEQDRHAQSVILSRMGDGSIPIAPIWDDITTLTRDAIEIPIDIIVGGFPCQDISSLGKGAGLEGKRSGLFFEVARLADELKPAFLFLENVPPIRTRGLDTVIEKLTSIGYDLRWTTLSASEVGAPHKRERWFCLGFNTNSQYANEKRSISSREITNPFRTGWNRETEPRMAGVVNGLPQRVDRIKRLGNAVVPQQAKEAFKILMGIK